MLYKCIFALLLISSQKRLRREGGHRVLVPLFVSINLFYLNNVDLYSFIELRE